MSSMMTVDLAIASEREYQKLLWLHKRTSLEYIVYIRDYANEALDLQSRYNENLVKVKTTDIMRKIAAMCQAWCEDQKVAGSYMALDSPGPPMSLIVFAVEIYKRAETVLLQDFPEQVSPHCLYNIHALAYNCMRQHGVLNRDGEGDLAKRMPGPDMQ